jgi:hypothetical protein
MGKFATRLPADCPRFNAMTDSTTLGPSVSFREKGESENALTYSHQMEDLSNLPLIFSWIPARDPRVFVQ